MFFKSSFVYPGSSRRIRREYWHSLFMIFTKLSRYLSLSMIVIHLSWCFDKLVAKFFATLSKAEIGESKEREKVTAQSLAFSYRESTKLQFEL